MNQAITIRYGNHKINLNKAEDQFAVLLHNQDTNKKIITLNRVNGGGTADNEIDILMNKKDFRIVKSHHGTPYYNTASNVFYNNRDTTSSPIVPTGEVFIVIDESFDIAKFVEDNFLKIIEVRDPKTYILKITTDTGFGAIELCVKNQNTIGIEVIEPDLAISKNTSCCFGDTPVFNKEVTELFHNQWHLHNTGKGTDYGQPSMFLEGADSGAKKAWDEIIKKNLLPSKQYGAGVIIAVIDDGFDTQHESFRNGDKSKIVSSFDVKTGIDKSTYGWGEWHGTSVAALALADRPENSISGVKSKVLGAAPDAKGIFIKFDVITDANIESMFSHATDNNADIITNSWGAAGSNYVMSTRIRMAITKAATTGRNGKGCVILFAAGNSNVVVNDGSFASHPDVICVAACNSRDQSSTYSNKGFHLDITGPSNGTGGAGVVTADVRGSIKLPNSSTETPMGYSPGAYTNQFGGTSAATPIIAGCIALLLSVNPELTRLEVTKIVLDSVKKIGGNVMYNPDGRSPYFGFGRIDAHAAVKIVIDSLTNPDEIILEHLESEPRSFDTIYKKLSEIKEEYKGVMYKVHLEGNSRLFLYDNYANRKLKTELRDFDIFIQKDRPATYTDYFLSSESVTMNESMVLTNLEPADYYITVVSKKGVGQFYLAIL